VSGVALVTGAAGGIGRAVCARLTQAGYTVIGADKNLPGAAESDWEVRGCDFAEPPAVKNLMMSFSRLDLIVNNAAIMICKTIAETELEDWDDTFAANTRSCFLTTKYGAPLLEESGGCIVNVGSVHALATSVGAAAYASSKGALAAFTRSAAVELADRGIRVNCVLPAAVDTAMLRAGLSRGHLADDASVDARVQELGARHPLGRVGTPEEIAAVVSFLCSKDASFLTGACLTIDGGAMARLSTE